MSDTPSITRDDVAHLAGISREEVVARHQASAFEVAFCGFSPGFAYLRGLDPVLEVPRLASPRPGATICRPTGR